MSKAKTNALSRRDVAVGLVLDAKNGLRFTRFGIPEFPKEAKIEDAALILRAIKTVEDGYQWAHGYWLLWIEETFGHEHSQLLDPEDGDPDTRSKRANVCKVFAFGSQKWLLSWSHYEAVYKVPEVKDRSWLLTEALANAWNVHFLREQAKRFKQGKTKIRAHDRAAPDRDKWIEAKVLINPDRKQDAYDRLDGMQKEGMIEWEVAG